MSASAAVDHAFEHVGPAILATTAIVSFGFAMLGMSTFRVTSYMGILTALTVVCALLVDLFLLPALLITLDGRRATDRVAEPSVLRAHRPIPAMGD